MSNYSVEVQNALNNLSPVLRALGLLLGDELDAIRTLLSSGNLGITADAGDVDSVARDGGHFSLNSATTSGLTLGYKAGRFDNGLIVVSVAAGTIALSASTTNYVEVDRAGTVSSNTSGFTSGRLPLWQVVTGASQITTTTSKKPLMTLIGLAGVVGSMLSTMGQTKEVGLQLGDISTTGTKFRLSLPNHAGTIARATLVPGAAIGTSDTDYWTMGAINKGTANAGTAVVADIAAAANSTKVTGPGSALAVNVPRALTLTGVALDLAHAANDVVEFTFNKTGTPGPITGASLRVDTVFTG